MENPREGEIGSTIGLIAEGEKHVGIVISFDDASERVTIRREDGVEITGSYNYVYTNIERMMENKTTSNWTPMADPSLRDIAQTSGKIIGIAFVILVVVTLFSIGAILTQIDSENWVETQGEVVDAYNGQDCSTDSDGTTSCISYTAVTVAYTYEGENYTTKDYSMLSNNWLNGAAHWLDQESVTVYVNPEQPSQAVHLQGWDGVLEELFTLLFFTGIILGGYVFILVPVWFVYAKIQRLSGIEAPGDKQKKRNMQTSEETDDNSKAEDTEPDKDDTPPESTAEESTVEEEKQDAKFW
jgi:hypothetical protein